MTETTRALKTACDLQADACYLAAVLEGIDVLYDNVETPGEVGRMAANAIVAILADARRRASDLSSDLDHLCMRERKGAAA